MGDAGIRRRSPEDIVVRLIVRADVIYVALNDPRVWAYLGLQRLGRAQDALDELRSALNTPSDDSCRCNEQAREIGGEALRRVEAEQGRLDDARREP